MKLKKLLGILLALVMVVCLSTVAFAADEPTVLVVGSGEGEYATLQNALNDCTLGGDYIIKLNGTIDEETDFKQVAGVNITIDGQNTTTYTGTIKFHGNALEDGKLTIQNIAFTTDKTSHDFIKSVNTNYYPSDLLIQNCSFAGTSDINTEGYGVVAVRLKSAKNVEIKNCTGTGLHSFLQNTAGWNLTIDNVDITNSLSGFAMGTVQGATVKNCDITAAGSGIRFDAQYNNNAVIENNNINAFIPVVVRKASVDGSLTFNGTNTMTATNTDGLWCAIGTSEYETNGTMPTAPTADIIVTLNDTGLSTEGVYGEYTYPVYIGSQGYDTLAEAFTAADDGDEVVIKAAGTYALSTSGKDITITGAVDGVVFDNIGAKNMGGANVTFNNVTFNYYPNKNYTGLQHSGNLTYNDCTFNGQVFLYGVSETFNNCTFNQNSADAYNVWTYGAQSVEFNGCTFNCVGKAVLVYNEGACATDLAVADTEFIASAPVSGKAAIEIDTSLMEKNGHTTTTITVDADTSAENFGTGSVSGDTLWNDKKADSNKVNGGTASTVIVGGETVKYCKPMGTITYGFTNTDCIWGEATANANESFYIEVYAGDVLLGTTTLNNLNNIIDGDLYVTWSIPFAGSDGGYWTAVWEEGYPVSTVQPTKVVLYVDGEKVAENDVQMNGPDNLNPVVWTELQNINHPIYVGDKGYATLDDLFADTTLSGDVTVTLLADVVAENKVNISYSKDVKYNFVTSVEGGVTMDFQYADNWNNFHKYSIGENVTLNAAYLYAIGGDINIAGTMNINYLYLYGTGEGVVIEETGVVNANIAEDKTVQVKGGTILTVKGELNTSTLNVWTQDVNNSELIVTGANAEVNVNWLHAWNGKDSVSAQKVVVENGATLNAGDFQADRGSETTVDNAALVVTGDCTFGYDDNVGTLNVVNAGEVDVTGTLDISKNSAISVEDGSEVSAATIKIVGNVELTEGTYIGTFDVTTEGATLSISGGIFSEDPSAYCVDGYTGYQNADGTYGIIEATPEEVIGKANVTITVTPADAAIVIEQDGVVIGTAAGTYTLPGGTYSYTVSKSGYYTEEGTITVAGEEQTVTVSLAKLPTLYNITKAACENGKVTAQAVMAAQGSTIKVSAVPNDGYKVASLTVTDAAGNEIEVVDGAFKMPASGVTVSAAFVYDLPFTDVADDDEHYNAIAYMYSNGLMVGTSTEEYIFDGDVKMTRSQIAMILYNLAGEPETAYTGVFTDAPEGAWYTEAVEWAASKGIMVGVGDGTFAHNRQITVVEMAALIYRYAQCQMNGQCEAADWATESAAAMTWCVENGILAEGTVSTDIADRYLAADVFYSVYNLLNK